MALSASISFFYWCELLEGLMSQRGEGNTNRRQCHDVFGQWHCVVCSVVGPSSLETCLVFSGWSLGLQFFLPSTEESIASRQVWVAFAAFASTAQRCSLRTSVGLGVHGLGGAQSQITDYVQGSIPGRQPLNMVGAQVLKGLCLDVLHRP